MIYDVMTFGKEVLREKAVPVKEVSDDIRQLAKDMLLTMYASNGVGLAAEQIGRTESICVIDDSPPPDSRAASRPRDNEHIEMPLVMINPRITDEQGEQVDDEGCLSFPDIFTPVKRAEQVTAEYLDEKGKQCTVTAHGLLSRAIQHEIDHLNGVLLVDHMSMPQKLALSGKLKRLKKQNRQ